MYYSLHWHSSGIVIIIISIFNVQFIAQVLTDENSGQVPDDFVDFLRDLGSMVYTRTKKPMPVHKTTTRLYVETTQKPPHNINTAENINTQKAALRDALMLKLVSYYEDKYSLSHHEPITTSSTKDVKTTKKGKRLNMEIVETPKMRPTVKFNNLHIKYPVNEIVVI